MSDNILEKTRARMLLHEPFWASLAMNLNLIVDTTIETGCVDGRVLRYNPEYLAALPSDQQETFMAHEAAHCALGHPWRVGSRDPEVANDAADYVVNDTLLEAGFTPIPGWLYDPQYKGWTFEQVYSKLMAKRQQQPEGGQGQPGEGQNGAGKGQDSPATASTGQGQGSTPGSGRGPCPTGEFTAAPPEEEASTGEVGSMSEMDWKMAVEQALAVSKAAGTAPGAMAVAVAQNKEPKVDWVSALREFVTQNMPTTQSWTTPNRRFIHQGLYLPGPYKESTGRGVLAVDCSGSTMPYQKLFAGEFKGILADSKPEELTIIYWDAKSEIPASDVETVQPDDFDLAFKPRGFGGTVFSPVLQYIEKMQLDPAFLVVLTDLYFTHPKQDPGYPVLWCVPDYCRQAAPPIGRVLYIPKET